MQSAGREKPPVGVVFDTDMGNSIDDALALALLYGLAGKEDPEARVVSISVSIFNLEAAAFCEAVQLFYSDLVNRELPPKFRRRGRALPVGLSLEGTTTENAPMLSAPLSKRDTRGEPLYEHDIHKLNDTADGAALIRNALTAQHDQNALVVLAGPATNLAKVLDLRGAKDLIAQKVRFLSMMGGAYPEGPAEFNMEADIPAAQKIFAEWPTPIVASGYEIGEALLYPSSSIENDFAWAEHHPIVDAYRAFKPMPYDARTWDLSAVLHAIRPDKGYFELSEPGTIQVLDDGRTKFAPSPEGRHRYLILDPAQRDRIIRTYMELVSAQPAPREPPEYIKKLIEEEKKQEEEKKLREQPAPEKEPRA